MGAGFYKDAVPTGLIMLRAAGMPMGAMVGGQWRGSAGQSPPSALICQCGSAPVGARHAVPLHLKYAAGVLSVMLVPPALTVLEMWVIHKPSLLGWARLYCPFGAVVCTRLACLICLFGIAPPWFIFNGYVLLIWLRLDRPVYFQFFLVSTYLQVYTGS